MNKINLFLNKDYCSLCGSQRCDKTEEWVLGCRKYKDFLDNFVKDNRNNYPVKKLLVKNDCRE